MRKLGRIAWLQNSAADRLISIPTVCCVKYLLLIACGESALKFPEHCDKKKLKTGKTIIKKYG